MVTVKLWCCVCVFVAPKRELCDGLSVMWPDRTGQYEIGRYRTRRDRKRRDRSRQDRKGTGRDVVVTNKLWCCVCVFVTPKCEFCNGLSVTWPNRTGQDVIGQDRTQRYRRQQDRAWQDTKGTGRDGTEQNRTGQDRTGWGCSWWFGFNSSVGSSIVLCMYVKLYYLLVTDLSKK